MIRATQWRLWQKHKTSAAAPVSLGFLEFLTALKAAPLPVIRNDFGPV
jgi:hypothetical protein